MIVELKTKHKPYAPASATNVQRTWKKYGWVAPSKDQAVVDKWNYYKSLSLLSEASLQFTKEPK
jgi:hypothetical protein